MRIAQVPPLAERIPPKLYGGTERVVSWLTEELVALGHEVSLFGTADAITKATLVPVWPSATRLSRPQPVRSPPWQACWRLLRQQHLALTSSTAISIGCTSLCCSGFRFRF